MSQDRERIVAQENRDDRLNDLPRNVIDHILELLPAKDAARTSILARKWRYIWAMLPYLKLDCRICDYEAEDYPLVFKQTIYEILFQHLGDIVKFELSGVYMTQHRDIDKWILYVIRNGVKELTLDLYHITTYTLPSYVFNCPTLTHLELNSCCFKPPNSLVGFQKLKTLRLDVITFVPTTEVCTIDAPLLVSLDVIDCHGTQYLRIVSPRLERLDVQGIHYLLLLCFLNCQNLKAFYINYDIVVDDPNLDKRAILKKLLFSLASTLERLNLDSVFLELFSVGTCPEGASFSFSSLCNLFLSVDFGKLSQASDALQLITSSPNLGKLDIWVDEPGDSNLNTLPFLDRRVNKLKHVVMHMFKGSTAELLFLKLLFACTPSLLMVTIKPEIAFDSTEESNIIAELIRFPKASPNVELCYWPGDAQ